MDLESSLNPEPAAESSSKLEGNLWHRLTEPHQDIISPPDRRRARLITSLFLPGPALVIIVAIILLLTSGDYPWLPLSIAFGGLVAGFFISRSPRWRLAAWFLVGICTVSVLVGAITDASGSLPFLVLSLFLGAMLLSVRDVLIIAVVNSLGVLILSTFVDAPMEIFGNAIIFQIVIGFIATIAGILRTQDLDQIEGQSVDLKRSNEELTRFAYVVSHDLKAPLRAIENLSSWIEEALGDKLEGESRENIALLRNRSGRMRDLINGILDYSRVGRSDTETEKVDVLEVIRDVVEMLDPPDNFDIVLPELSVTIIANKTRTQQIFANLLSNAIKYHDKDRGRIEFGIEKIHNFYQFSVADDGPGIAEHYFDKIFGMFETLQSRDEIDSTGVGLSIVKKIVEQNGGDIRVESELGKGSRFLFTWPIK